MRTFYIFKVKEEFIKLYEDNPKGLFRSFKRIYNMNKNSINLGFNLFNQIVDILDKEELDRYLYVKLHNKMFYTKQENDHIINNLYKDEISILRVKKSFMKLEINKDYSMFFDILNDYYGDYFLCDFINEDYFFLKNIKTLV